MLTRATETQASAVSHPKTGHTSRRRVCVILINPKWYVLMPERLWHWKWNESHWLDRFTTSLLSLWCLRVIMRSLCHYANSIYVSVYSSQYHPTHLRLFLKTWAQTCKFQKKPFNNTRLFAEVTETCHKALNSKDIFFYLWERWYFACLELLFKQVRTQQRHKVLGNPIWWILLEATEGWKWNTSMPIM